MIIGNIQQQKILKNLIDLDVSPILLSGPEGVGKFFCVKEYLKSKDYEKIIIDSEEKIIKIESVRFLVNINQRKSNKRVIVINDAHKLQYQSQNTLLKSLEEKLSKTIFILITHRPYKILSTIRSRSIIIRFNLLSKDETKKILEEKGFDYKNIELVLDVYPYQPGKALNLLKNKEKLEIFKKFIKNPLLYLQDLKKAYSLSEFLEDYISWFRYNKVFYDKIYSLSKKDIFILKEILNLYNDSSYNLNFELQITNLFLNIKSVHNEKRLAIN